jgi:hypothetical protein
MSNIFDTRLTEVCLKILEEWKIKFMADSEAMAPSGLQD